jgi:hypothetical protein
MIDGVPGQQVNEFDVPLVDTPVPRPKRRGTKLVAAAIAIVLILAVVVILSTPRPSSGDPNSKGLQLANGDLLRYDLTTQMDGFLYEGTCTIVFMNVSSSSCNVMVNYSFIGVSVEDHTFIDLTDTTWIQLLSTSLGGSSEVTFVDVEQLTTVHGVKTVNHYHDTRNGVGLWVDVSTNCLYKLGFFYEGYEIGCVLAETNMEQFGG